MNALTIRRTPVRALLHSAVHFGLALAACLIVALPGAAVRERHGEAEGRQARAHGFTSNSTLYEWKSSIHSFIERSMSLVAPTNRMK